MSAAAILISKLQLQFAPEKIPVLARQYMVTDRKKDEEAFKAGARIRDGYFGRDNLPSDFPVETKDLGVSRLATGSPKSIM